LFLDADDNILLADFGMAKKLANGKKDYVQSGSPYYIAPEVLLASGADVKADMWSVGVLIYELLVGKPPFDGANLLEIRDKIISNKPTFPDDVASDAKELMQALLKSKALERKTPQDALQFKWLKKIWVAADN